MGPGEDPRALREHLLALPCPTSFLPPLCPLPQSIPHHAPPQPLLPVPREALPGEVPRGLICCHLISICCTWELSLDRDLGKQEGEGEAVKWRSSGEGPIPFLPSLARPLQASALSVQGPLAVPGVGRRRSMKHCVWGADEWRQQFWSWVPSSQPPGLESEDVLGWWQMASGSQSRATWPSPCLGGGVFTGLCLGAVLGPDLGTVQRWGGASPLTRRHPRWPSPAGQRTGWHPLPRKGALGAGSHCRSRPRGAAERTWPGRSHRSPGCQ